MVIANILTQLGVQQAIGDYLDLYRSNVSGTNQDRLIFPADIASKKAYIVMRFARYQRRAINQQPFYQTTTGITLPIPNKLVDTTSVTYDKTDLGPVAGAIADTFANIGQGNDVGRNQSIQGAVQAAALQGVTSAIPGAIGAAAGAVAARAGVSGLSATAIAGSAGVVANRAVNVGVNVLQSLTGTSFNPFQTVLFKAPNFKQHSFSWRLIPKNKEESEIIKNIVNIFRYHMLPSVSQAGGIFFGYPEILQIKLFPKDEYTYKFKPCVVESVSINYAPNGPSFYRETEAPTAVEFTIQVSEIEIWTKQDFNRDANGRPIGGPNVIPSQFR